MNTLPSLKGKFKQADKNWVFSAKFHVSKEARYELSIEKF